jgi:predicted branched-subunit amino acid permease
MDGRGQAFWLGVRALLPMHLGVMPFGVIYGIVALQSGIPPLAAVLMSSIVFAGSAQFLIAQLVGVGAPALLMVGAAGLVNLRHALYSASVAPVLEHLPMRWKVVLGYFLTDEAYAAAIPHLLAEPRSPFAHWILLGAGFALWAGWQVSTVFGVLLGAELPTGWSLDFALPLTFIAIVVPLLTDRKRIAVALVAGGLAVLLAGLPYKLGLFAAALGALLLAGLWPGRVGR